MPTATPSSQPLQSRLDRIGGQTIHARVSCERRRAVRPAVVLLHGLLVSSRYMLPTAQRLAAYYDVFVRTSGMGTQ